MRLTVNRFTEHQMIELFGHFLWQTSLHFSVWMHLNCSAVLHVYFWHGDCGNLYLHLNKKKISTSNAKIVEHFVTKKKKKINLSSFCLSFKFFFSFVSQQAVAFWLLATSYLFPCQTSMCKNSWFCVSRLIEHIKIHCIATKLIRHHIKMRHFFKNSFISEI